MEVIHSPAKPVERVTDNQIEAIYQAYPRHIGKSAALKAITKSLKKSSFDELLETVKEFAKSPAGQAGKFTPHPATWFNEGRWQDDPAEWSRAETSNHAANGAPPPKPRCCTPEELEQLTFADIAGGSRE